MLKITKKISSFAGDSTNVHYLDQDEGTSTESHAVENVIVSAYTQKYMEAVNVC